MQKSCVKCYLQTILFTTDEEILEAVSKNDDAFEGELLSDSEDDVPFQRPSTADNQEDDEVNLFSCYNSFALI